MLARSWLFVPGNSERRLKKAEILAADVLIYDLEDAVAPEEKENARKSVLNALSSSKKNVVVRVNSMDSPYFFEDIQVLFQHRLDALKGIMLPKTADAKQIQFLEQLMKAYEQRLMLGASLEIVPLIENALGIHNCFAIAGSSPRIRRLAFGAIDYALDVNIDPSEDGREFLYARSRLVNSSRAAELESPIDTVYADFSNTEGMEQETLQARKLGFGGKLVIHPKQLEIVHKSFTPSLNEVNEALEMLGAAEASGKSAFQFHGKMVDEPVLKKARKLIAADKLLKEKEDGVERSERN